MWNLARRSAARGLVPAILLAAACDQPERVPPGTGIIATARGSVVHNAAIAPPLVLHQGIAPHPTFLFAGVRAAAIDPNGDQALLTPDGDRLLLFDAGGRLVRTVGRGSLDGISVTMARGGWLVVEDHSRVLLVRPTGDVTELALARGTAAGFSEPIGPMRLTRLGDGYLAARMPVVRGDAVDPPVSPLLLQLDETGRVTTAIDTAARMRDPILTNIANSGQLASNGSMAFFAYDTRDEIRAYDRRGRLRWTADRGMTWPRDATLPADMDFTRLSYSSVNLAVTVRDDLLYVLAHGDSAGTTMRIDALETETGILRGSVTFPAARALISVDADGALWQAPADTLDTISAPPRTVVDFDLPTLRGDTLSLRDYRGKVVLVNIWASWCDPCRDEFPLLAGLARERAGEDFAIIGVSDDVDEGKAQRFVAELEPPYAIALGRGALKRQLNYRGIPFTVLLDRDGRVIKRYIGFGGERQFERLRADVLAAIEKRGRPD